LGLAICKSIVERHHGELSVSSEADAGARFRLILPIKPTAQQGLPIELVNVIHMAIG
jgi:signal transduction histidine kinase